MKNLIIAIVIVIALLTLGVFLLKDVVVKAVFERGLKSITGLEFYTDGIDVDLFAGKVSITGLQVLNPGGYSEKIMAKVPQINVECDMLSLLINRVYIRSLLIRVDELNVVFNKQGKINIYSLGLLLPKPKGARPPLVKIDSLEIKIRKVVFKNYFLAGSPQELVFMNLIEDKFLDVTNPTAIAEQVLNKIITRGKFKTGRVFKERIGGTVGKIQEEIKRTAEELEGIFKGMVID